MKKSAMIHDEESGKTLNRKFIDQNLKYKRAKKPMKGQEEIFKALKARDFNRLWDLCKAVGYNKVENPNIRMMLLREAFHKFDYTMNNNFITFYMTRLNYYAMASHETKLIQDTKAMFSDMEKNMWPTVEEEVTSQNLNILQSFSF